VVECAVCATPVPDDSKFCHNCGSLVSDAEGQSRASRAMDISATLLMEKLLKEATAGVYQVEKMIGKGGMACVYLATEIQLGRKVAIKVLPPELTFGHGVERFMREAKTAALLEHPNIIPIYRVATEGKIFWYSMKYLEGRSLDDALKEKGRFSLQETVEILSKVAGALDYAHQRGVVHRDIKPANVMLDPFGSIIVTDFGIAKAVSGETLTASGAVVGTPIYMSPEQATGSAITGRADQYSVAVMAFQMLSGKRPFEGESAFDIMFKHCKDPVPPLDVLRPGLPAHTCRAVEKAMAKLAEDRFPTVRAFVEGLADPWETRPSAATEVLTSRPPRPAGAARPATPARPKRRVLPAALAVTILAGGGIGAWLWMQARAARIAATRSVTRDTVAAIAPPPAPDTTRPARVTVANLPAGGTITVDGAPRTGPELELAPGRHVIGLAAPGYTSTSDTVTLAAGEALRVVFTGRAVPRPAAPPLAERRAAEPPPRQPPPPTTGVVRINTAGSWAAISIDGVRKAESNRHVETLAPGVHAFRFERDGYATIDTTVTLRAGDTLRLQIQMRPRP
jgi:serine/threonine-protein kinase